MIVIVGMFLLIINSSNYSSLDEILPGLEKYGALKKEFEEYHEKLEREQVIYLIGLI